MKKKILGLVGGIGPESTVDYYKMIIKKYREKSGNGNYPEFLINSINMTAMLSYVQENKFKELILYLAYEIKKLEMAGAGFAALASNTPHIVFDQLQNSVNIPMISIVEETIKYISEKKIEKVGLFGTMFTMNAGFYQKVGEKYSVEVITPDQKDKEFIHEKYFSELVAGIIKDDTREMLRKIAETLKDQHNITGLVLGGTELPLILKQENFLDIELLNTSEIHVDSIVNKMLS